MMSSAAQDSGTIVSGVPEVANQRSHYKRYQYE